MKAYAVQDQSGEFWHPDTYMGSDYKQKHPFMFETRNEAEYFAASLRTNGHEVKAVGIALEPYVLP